jgi:hypothetical protein
MKVGIRLVEIALAVALIGGVARAEFKGRHDLDKKFETYNVKKIALDVRGTWAGAASKVDPKKVIDNITEALERKGYEVVELKKGKAEKEVSADAVLKVMYKSMSVGALPFVDGSTRTDYAINGSAQLALTATGKKVIYKASGGTASVFQEKGRSEEGRRTIDTGDPAQEFAKIVDPIPSLPEAKEKEGKEGEKAGEGEKKDEGGKKEKKDDGEK